MPTQDINVPTYDTEDITLGQCKVFIDNYSTPSASGVTPSTDMGAIDEATVSISRDLLDLKQGVPQLLIQQWAIGEVGTLNVKGWEWNQENFYKVFAAGSTSNSGSDLYYDFGGDIAVRTVQIRLEHITPVGATIWLDFWKCSGNGALDFMFNPTDFNKFDYTFNLWRGAANWIAGSLTGSRLFKYSRIAQP